MRRLRARVARGGKQSGSRLGVRTCGVQTTETVGGGYIPGAVLGTAVRDVGEKRACYGGSHTSLRGKKKKKAHVS